MIQKIKKRLKVHYEDIIVVTLFVFFITLLLRLVTDFPNGFYIGMLIGSFGVSLIVYIVRVVRNKV